MLKVILSSVFIVSLTFVSAGCSTSTVKGKFLSGEKNIWIEDEMGSAVTLCLANIDGNRASPVCFAAKRSLLETLPGSAQASMPPETVAPISTPATSAVPAK